MSASPVSKLADHIEKIGLEELTLVEEYRYASLPLCVVDAVFSIGVRYSSTQKVVENLCHYTGWSRFATSRDTREAGERQISDLIRAFDKGGVKYMAERVFQNRQRTSAQSVILKAEAVLLYCQALADAGINNFKDLTQDRRE